MTEPLWSQRELAEAFGAPPSAPLGAPVAGVSIDTRTLAPGDLFFAIKGETSDGHDYVARAFTAGASACVVARTGPGRQAGWRRRCYPRHAQVSQARAWRAINSGLLRNAGLPQRCQ